MTEDLKQLLASGLDRLGISYSDPQVTALMKYIELVLKWNKTYNLTAITDLREAVIRHLLDSAALVPYLDQQAVDGKLTVLDVGCGAGLPTVPCAILRPEYTFTCVDAVQKKIAFVTQAKALLSLQNINPTHIRIESKSIKSQYQVITSRAFSSIENFVNLTERLLDENGRWLALKAKLDNEMDRLPAFVITEAIVKLDVPYLNETRNLVVLSKKAI